MLRWVYLYLCFCHLGSGSIHVSLLLVSLKECLDEQVLALGLYWKEAQTYPTHVHIYFVSKIMCLLYAHMFLCRVYFVSKRVQIQLWCSSQLFYLRVWDFLHLEGVGCVPTPGVAAPYKRTAADARRRSSVLICRRRDARSGLCRWTRKKRRDDYLLPGNSSEKFRDF